MQLSDFPIELAFAGGMGVVWFILSSLPNRMEPHIKGHERGEIRPAKGVLALVSLLFLSGASLFAWAGQGLEDPALVYVIAGVLALIGLYNVALLLQPGREVFWDRTKVSGPTRGLLGPLGTGRTTLLWTQIYSLCPDSLGGWYLTARDGREISWSGQYAGGGWLNEAAMRLCPTFVEIDRAIHRDYDDRI